MPLSLSRGRVVLAVAPAVLGVLILVLVSTSREPVFEGRTATAWLNEAAANPNQLDRYGRVFLQWQDQGIRFLVRQLTVEPPVWKRFLVDLNNRVGTRMGLKYIPAYQDGSRKLMARRLLGYFEARAAPRLIRMLRSAAPTNQAEAIRAIAELGPAAAPVAGEPLLAFLKDSSVVNVFEAITSLAVIDYDPQTVVPLLVPFLQHTNNRVRIEASYALGTYPPMPDVTLKPLLAALHDSDLVVRANSARALGVMGPRAAAALEPLARQLNDKPLAAARAVEAIALIAGRIPPECAAEYRKTMDQQRTALDSYNRLMVLHASSHLGLSVEDLKNVGRMAISLRTSNWQAWEAVAVIAELDPRPAWVKPLLEEAEKHPNGRVRALARQALERSSHKPR